MSLMYCNVHPKAVLCFTNTFVRRFVNIPEFFYGWSDGCHKSIMSETLVLISPWY